MTRREHYRNRSNNKENPNKNICILAVVKYFGAHLATRHLHTFEDVIKAIRTQFTVRSRKSSVKGKTVGAIRKELAALTKKEGKDIFGYYIGVPGHGMLLNHEGKTIVDTDPRKKDKRKITHLHVVYQ